MLPYSTIFPSDAKRTMGENVRQGCWNGFKKDVERPSDRKRMQTSFESIHLCNNATFL